VWLLLPFYAVRKEKVGLISLVSFQGRHLDHHPRTLHCLMLMQGARGLHHLKGLPKHLWLFFGSLPTIRFVRLLSLHVPIQRCGLPLDQ
jgi:hypothetical protein